MINASSNDIIIHVPMETAVVRIAGIDKTVLRPARGFAWVEHSDGTQSPISNPFYSYVLENIWGNPAGDFAFGFVIEAPGDVNLNALDETVMEFRL